MADPAPREPRLRPSGPILSAASLGIWAEAEAGLKAAREHQRAMRDWAQGLCERERERGHAEGEASGREEAARIVAQTTRRASAHLAELERGLPDLVGSILSDILGTFGEDELIARCVRQAVAKLQPDSTAVLHVSPGQVEAIRDALRGPGEEGGIEIEADPTLALGECSLRSSIGNVELGIEAQLRALRAALSGGATDRVVPSGNKQGEWS